MAMSGQTVPGATVAPDTTNSSIKALTVEVQQLRRRLAALDETYVTDDDITKNDTLENMEL